MKILTIIFVYLSFMTIKAQNTMEEKLPYYEIPEYPESYTASTVAARMVDGLGHRYYWATESLREQDLEHKASESGRTSEETIEHIYGLSKFIRNSILVDNKDNTKGQLSFYEKRQNTLLNLKMVSEVLRNTDSPYNLDSSEVPFWNIINGPIADAIWHCGQLVMLRRASGNPFNSKVSVFAGKLKE